MTQAQIRKVFISYRQADNRPFVMLIHKYLTDKYGANGVFLDFNTLPPFVKFEDFIRQRIQESDAVLAIIGHDWLKHFNDRAAEDEKDYVKIELETALRLNKLIAPVCIMGASMPRRRDVPESLRDLCDINAVNLTDDRAFYEEMARLIEGLESALQWKNPPLMSNGMTAERYFERGGQKWGVKDYQRAIEDCTDAIRLKPDYALAYNRRGAVRYEQHDYDGAIADYNGAIRLDPKFALAYYNRGLAHHDKGDLNGAIADFNEAIRLDLKLAPAYYNRGALRDDKGDLDGAIADYTEAIRLDSKYANAYLNRGIVRELKHDVHGAISDWEQYLALGGGDRDKVTLWIAVAKKKLKS